MGSTKELLANMPKLLNGRFRVALSAAIVLVLLLAVGEAALVSACPMCKESVDQAGMDGSTGSPTGTNPLGAGFAWSIYLMLAVPYLMIGTGAFVVWRGVRRSQEPVPARVSREGAIPQRPPAVLTEP